MLLVCLSVGLLQERALSKAGDKAKALPPPPRYKVDISWPKELPNNWIVGQIGGMAIDANDHIWVLQRPRSNTLDEIGSDPKSPRSAMCCVSAPPVLVFDRAGNLLKSWGGPGAGYDWPDSEHGIAVQKDGTVWIGGNGGSDRQLLKFTNDGKFIAQFGKPSKNPPDSLDKTTAGHPAGLTVDEDAHELYVADGYINRRILVLDTATMAFKRMWGAYGNVPNDVDPGPYNPTGPHDQQFRTPVHCAAIARDGLVYVCDRQNDRIQVFTMQGKFVNEFYVHTTTREPGTVCDIVFSHDPQQAYLLVVDNTDNVIWTLRRDDERHGGGQFWPRRPQCGAVPRRSRHGGGLLGQSLHRRSRERQTRAEIPAGYRQEIVAATKKSKAVFRCSWADGSPMMSAYHDDEWGVPERDSRALWAKLMLDGFQAGLSWSIILKKRGALCKAFRGFDPKKVARFTARDVARLLQDPGIIRSRAKIEATIAGARAYLAMQDAGEDFSKFVWGLAGNKTVQNAGPIPTKSPLSEEISKQFKKRGFKFCGPVIVYAWMQAIGMVNDHHAQCFRRKTCGRARPKRWAK